MFRSSASHAGLVRFVLGGLAVCWPALVMASDKATDDSKGIQGTWQVTHLEEQGESSPADKVKDVVYIFDGDKLSIKYQGKVVAEATVKLDSATTPKQIDLVTKDETNRGIYKLEKNRLTLCATAFKRNGTRPTEFTTKAESLTMLVVLERQK